MSREHDPEIATRIAQHEMAFRTQSSVPEVTDGSGESEATFQKAPMETDAKKPGTFLPPPACWPEGWPSVESVSFKLFHQGWDQHEASPGAVRNQCKETDQASAALVTDLKQRGLLEGHPGGLGWRIRPHHLFSRQADGR